jgi:hypothetical protein
MIMSMRVKLCGGVALTALALTAWRLISPSADGPLAGAPEPVAAPLLREGQGGAAAPNPVTPKQAEPTQNSSAEAQPAEPAADPTALNERALVGTKWEREGIGLEFGADGKLLMGGRERAKWRVEGRRIRLFRDTSGEEHWLDIVGNKLMWEGREIGRVR